jgi:hypothetical protein
MAVKMISTKQSGLLEHWCNIDFKKKKKKKNLALGMNVMWEQLSVYF